MNQRQGKPTIKMTQCHSRSQKIAFFLGCSNERDVRHKTLSFLHQTGFPSSLLGTAQVPPLACQPRIRCLPGSSKISWLPLNKKKSIYIATKSFNRANLLLERVNPFGSPFLVLLAPFPNENVLKVKPGQNVWQDHSHCGVLVQSHENAPWSCLSLLRDAPSRVNPIGGDFSFDLKQASSLVPSFGLLNNVKFINLALASYANTQSLPNESNCRSRHEQPCGEPLDSLLPLHSERPVEI